MTKNKYVPLSAKQKEIMKLFTEWDLSLSPLEFQIKWNVNYQQLADICGVKKNTVETWNKSLSKRSHPSKYALLRLAIADKLLENPNSPEVIAFLELDRQPKLSQETNDLQI